MSREGPATAPAPLLQCTRGAAPPIWPYALSALLRSRGGWKARSAPRLGPSSPSVASMLRTLPESWWTTEELPAAAGRWRWGLLPFVAAAAAMLNGELQSTHSSGAPRLQLKNQVTLGRQQQALEFVCHSATDMGVQGWVPDPPVPGGIRIVWWRSLRLLGALHRRKKKRTEQHLLIRPIVLDLPTRTSCPHLRHIARICLGP
jgi:hypothetical protein